MSRSAIRVAIAVVVVGLLSAAPAGAASIWTPLSSGTTQTISAISAPTAGEVVYATSGGQIHYLSGSSFVASTVTPTNSIGFTDIAMSPDGTKGVAVGPNAKIYQSTNSGLNWNVVSPPTDPSGACPTPGALAPFTDDLYSVHFADATTVYVTGNNGAVLKSITSGASFAEVNKSVGSCKADPGGTGTGFSDTQWIDANTGFLLSNFFGKFFATTDGMSGTPTHKTDAVNGFNTRDALALDPADPTRMWVTNPGAMNGSYFQSTSDGGTSWGTPTYDGNQNGFQDVAAGASGATLGVVAVGLGGDIYTSADGRNFNRQIADAPNNTTDWHAVAMLGPSTAFVGGAGGALVTSTQANAVPDTTAPTGTISGPTSRTVGQFGSYTVTATDNPGGSGIDSASYVWSTAGLPNQTGSPTASFAFSTTGVHTITVTFKDLAGNPGTATISVNVGSAPPPPPPPPPSGSHPVSTTTGGTTIVIFKIITVTGRKGRFIPVKLATKGAPRRFLISLLPIKGKKTLASMSKTLGKRKHVTAHLNVPRSVKSGRYRLVVKVFTTGRHHHQIGRSVKQVFVLV
jgi:photosystem II stability/assembly factor-like uncharacterized protein